MKRKELEELLQEYADAIGVRVGHYEKVPAGTPMDPATQVEGYGGEAAEPYRQLTGDGLELRTIPSGIVLDYNPAYGGYSVEQIAPNGRTWVSVLMSRRSNAQTGAWLREKIAAVHDHCWHRRAECAYRSGAWRECCQCHKTEGL